MSPPRRAATSSTPRTCTPRARRSASVGEFVKSDRDRFVVATRYSIATRFDDINAWGNSRRTSLPVGRCPLRRLDLDRIDLYWVHVADPLTPRRRADARAG